MTRNASQPCARRSGLGSRWASRSIGRGNMHWRSLPVSGRDRARRPAPSPGPTPRVLLIRPDHLGDVLCTSPAVQWIQSVCPWANDHLHGRAVVGRGGGPAARRAESLVVPVSGLCTLPNARPAGADSPLRPTVVAGAPGAGGAVRSGRQSPPGLLVGGGPDVSGAHSAAPRLPHAGHGAVPDGRFAAAAAASRRH